jgi:hypothetical protein
MATTSETVSFETGAYEYEPLADSIAAATQACVKKAETIAAYVELTDERRYRLVLPDGPEKAQYVALRETPAGFELTRWTSGLAPSSLRTHLSTFFRYLANEESVQPTIYGITSDLALTNRLYAHVERTAVAAATGVDSTDPPRS